MIGFVGGLVRNEQGRQMTFNYGPRQAAYTDLQAFLHHSIGELAKTDPKKALQRQERYAGFLKDWPNIFVDPAERQVFWSSEANLVIPSKVFTGIGGFDPSLREHEVIELAMRLYKQGLERRFDPALSALHTAVQVRTGNRQFQQFLTEVKIARMHGFRNFFLPDGKLKPEL